ncbi:hypothetical protein GE09DRAFT_32329 [Coniochaeta sp. 2T2.1]|nr:hypothetical protein GE09DRAFT_32329 [Coniochaeta sp. 2T2.1]
MYKRRLNLWNVQKNVKAGEVLAVLRSKEYNVPGDTPDKPHVIHVNGRDVPVDKVEQYLDRRRRQLQLLRRKGILDTQGQVYAPPQHPFKAADHLQIPEEMGRLIQQYIDGSFSAGAWIPGENRDDLRSRRSDGTVVYLFSNLFDACSHLRQNEIQAGFGKINQSLDLMDRALSEEDPRFLVSVFRVLALCHWYNLPDIYRILLTHLKRLSGIVLGPGHPASRIFSLLSSMQPGETDLGVKVAAELLCRHLQRYVVRSRNSGAHLNLLVSYVDTLESLGLYEESVEGIVEAMRYPDPRFKWSAETLELYFQFILRPKDNKPHVFPAAVVEGSPVCPPPKFVQVGEMVGIHGHTLDLEGSHTAAVEIMKYCYTLRAKALAEGRTTAMTKGGASMWPSLVTCPDEERRRILRDLLAERATAEERTESHIEGTSSPPLTCTNGAGTPSCMQTRPRPSLGVVGDSSYCSTPPPIQRQSRTVSGRGRCSASIVQATEVARG